MTPEPRGYFIAVSSVSHMAEFQQYRHVISRLREVYQGRDLVRACPLSLGAGTPADHYITIVEHPTVGLLHSLIANPEHAQLLDKMKILAPGFIWAAGGVTPPQEPFPESSDARAYRITRYHLDVPERFQLLKDLWSSLIARYGGRYLVRAQRVPNLWGPSDGKHLSICEFPSMRNLQSMLASPEIQDALALVSGRSELTVWSAVGVGDHSERK